ncbi:MAG: hypothetical protein AAB974_03310 [Patescibacteria group bacterium]
MRRTWQTALFMCTLVLLGTAVFASTARASDGDRLRGWLWSERVGWFSVNCVTGGGCPPEYGVDVADTVSSQVGGASGYSITGWAWSKNVGWMCFGSTCNGEADPPPGVGAVVPAYIDSGGEVHGWAKIISLKNRGWVSLNCDNTGAVGCSDYFVTMSLGTGTVTGFAWNGNDDGTGVGWIDFSTSTLVTNETLCADGLDGDLDGRIDCADVDCLGVLGPGGVTCGPESSLAECTDTNDVDGDGKTDCVDNLIDADGDICWHQDAYGCPSTELVCDDDVDNDVDDGRGNYDALPTSGVDCFDTDCLGVGVCLNEEAFFGGPGNEVANCSNGHNDDADSTYDCGDTSCAPWCPGTCEVNNAVLCVPTADPVDNQCPPDGDRNPTVCNPVYTPWLQALFEDIYSRRGIRAENPAPVGQTNATFCLVSAGGEVPRNFVVLNGAVGTTGCDPVPNPEDFKLPTSATNYSSPLGRIDIAGIKGGVYGRVTTLQFNEWSQVPDVLDGRIYYFPNNLDLNTTREFRNAVGTRSGAGLILVEGKLTINADLTYAAAPPGGTLRNLASLGIIVVDKRTAGGSLLVPATVGINETTVERLAGTYFVEGTVYTGSSNNQSLIVNGLMIARQFNFERNASASGEPAEQIVYDGRAVANPPPGMADVVSSLPKFTDVAPR